MPRGSRLDQPLASHGELLDQIEARSKPHSETIRNANGSLSGHGHFGLDDILGPIAPAGTDVSRKGEVRQRRKCNIMRAPDSGFQHAPAPDRDTAALAKVVDPARRPVATDPAELNIDDPAGAQLNGRGGLFFAVD